VRPGADAIQLAWNPEDRQARYIEAAVNGVLITSIYLPNGNPQPGPKFDYKLAWFERFDRPPPPNSCRPGACHLGRRLQRRTTVDDIYPTRSLDNKRIDSTSESPGLCSAASSGLDGRAAKTAARGAALDVLDYERNRWPLDKGMRLDHFLLAPTVCDDSWVGV